MRGEPGAGKSQLARAAAVALKRVFLSRFVDVRTEAQDLLWFQDAVARLADAQTQAAAGVSAETSERLARANYVIPGPLWWALDWAGALAHISKPATIRTPAPMYANPANPENGVVLLIDEIDKADNSVPNGLLEALGQGTFAVPGFDAPIRASGPPPLVILSTNEERSLPDAFLRRCIVLHLRVPEPDASGRHAGRAQRLRGNARGRARHRARRCVAGLPRSQPAHARQRVRARPHARL